MDDRATSFRCDVSAWIGCLIRAVVFVLSGDPKMSLRTFNALIIPVLRDCFTQLFFSISFLRHLPDTVLEVAS